MNNRKTRKLMRSRRIIGALAGAAILSGLTACGGAATPAPVGRADSALPSAITPQTANPTPSPTPSPSPVRTPTPAPTVNAIAIGDSCLVGRWTLMSLLMTDTASVPGATLTFTGQLGTVMTLGAEGTEVYDLTNSTRLVGVGNGHTISWQGQGVQQFQFRGEGGQWWESGPGQLATATNVVLDGVTQPDFSSVGPPTAGSYTCSASELRMTAVDPVQVTQVFRK